MLRLAIRSSSYVLSLLACSAPLLMAQDAARPPYYGNVSWSPNGKTLLFETSRDGKYAIYASAVDGARLRRLTPTTSNNEQASWSPDGKTIVFASNRDGHQQLYLMNRDGAKQRRLTRTDSTQDFYASFSPDGRWITFAVQPRRQWADYRVAVIRPNGKGRRSITDSTRTSEGPRWSAGGKRITFLDGPALSKSYGDAARDEVRERARAMRQVSVLPDGSDLQSAPPEQVADAGILSPDGRWRAVARTKAGEAGVYIVEITTGKERRVDGPPATDRNSQ